MFKFVKSMAQAFLTIEVNYKFLLIAGGKVSQQKFIQKNQNLK